MAGYRIYFLGFRENDFTADEQAKLDEHVSNRGSGWSGEPYKPYDKRNHDFDNVAATFADEGPRMDGKHIILYQELDIDAGEKNKFFEAFQEIKSLFPDIFFEAHDDNGKIG